MTSVSVGHGEVADPSWPPRPPRPPPRPNGPVPWLTATSVSTMPPWTTAPARGHRLDDAALAVAARHALHDEELVAAFATGSLEEAADVDASTGTRRSLLRVPRPAPRRRGDRCSARAWMRRGSIAAPARLPPDRRGRPPPRWSRRRSRLPRSVPPVDGELRATRRRIDGSTRRRRAPRRVGRPRRRRRCSATTAGADPALPRRRRPRSRRGPESTGGPKSSDRNGAYGPQSSAYFTGASDPPLDSAAVDANPGGLAARWVPWRCSSPVSSCWSSRCGGIAAASRRSRDS